MEWKIQPEFKKVMAVSDYITATLIISDFKFLNFLKIDRMDKITLIEYVKNRYILLNENNRFYVTEEYLPNIHQIFQLKQLFYGQFCKFIDCDAAILIITVH